MERPIEWGDMEQPFALGPEDDDGDARDDEDAEEAEIMAMLADAQED